ncbi:MAG: hypothetical protein WC139_06490 [Candidatus Kapaibacterium sp.]
MKNISIILLIIFASISSSRLNAQIKMLYDTEKSEKERIEGYINSGYSNISIFRIDIYEQEAESDTSLVFDIKISDDRKTITENDINNETGTITKFDSNISYREILNKEGKSAGKTIYTYGPEGFILKRELYFGEIKALDEVYEFKQDKTGNVKYYASDGTLMSNSEFRLNSQNSLIEELKYNSKGDTEQKYEYIYDSKGRMIEERIIFQNEQKTVTNYSYDENDNIIEEQTKDNGGNILSYNKFAYEGKKVIEELRDSRNMKLRKLYNYKGGLLKSVRFEDLIDKSVYVWVYEYN